MLDPLSHSHLPTEQIYEYLTAPLTGRQAEEIESCLVCRATAESLRRTLDQISWWEAPERPENYGSEVWRQIAGAAVFEQRRGRHLKRMKRIAWVCALGVAAALGIAAIVLPHHRSPASGASPGMVSESKQLLNVAVQDHVRRTDSLLEQIEADSEQPKRETHDLMLDRTTINNLVAENRLYRQTAEQENDQHTVRLLTDIETGLVALKHDSPVLAPSDVRVLRRKLVDVTSAASPMPMDRSPL